MKFNPITKWIILGMCAFVAINIAILKYQLDTATDEMITDINTIEIIDIEHNNKLSDQILSLQKQFDERADRVECQIDDILGYDPLCLDE